MTRTFETPKGKIYTDKNGKILKTEKPELEKHIGETIAYYQTETRDEVREVTTSKK